MYIMCSTQCSGPSECRLMPFDHMTSPSLSFLFHKMGMPIVLLLKVRRLLRGVMFMSVEVPNVC